MESNQAHYQIMPYQPNYKSQVVELLSYLWGENKLQNDTYFNWKYLNNPFAEDVTAILTLYKNNVVGFTGFFNTKWTTIGRNQKISILSPADLIVHPDHRHNRLSILMHDYFMNKYASKYTLFFNFSVSKISLPVILRMGFTQIAEKFYLNRETIFGIAKYISTYGRPEEINKSKIKFGVFDDILVSDKAIASEMAGVIEKQNFSNHRFTMIQDENFFNWRFLNPRKKYVFFYYKLNGVMTAYLVLTLSKNNRRGYISDFAAQESVYLKKILDFIIKTKQVDILSIYSYSADNNFFRQLKYFNFKVNSITRQLERVKKGEIPLFVRPVKSNYSDDDFIIEGHDIRKIDNWSLKEIFSDGV